MQTASRIGFSAVGAVALLASSNPDAPQTGPRGVPTLVEELRIGSLDGTCDAFGDVASLAVDGDGRIYVADRQARAIRVFAPQGECVRTFGRSGEGPGEFRWLEGIAWQPPGYLWAIDAIQSRLTVFDSLGTVLATHPVNLGPGASMPWPLWVDAGGGLHRHGACALEAQRSVRPEPSRSMKEGFGAQASYLSSGQTWIDSTPRSSTVLPRI